MLGCTRQSGLATVALLEGNLQCRLALFSLASFGPCDDSVPLLPFPRSRFAPLPVASTGRGKVRPDADSITSNHLALARHSQHWLATSLDMAHPPFSVTASLTAATGLCSDCPGSCLLPPFASQSFSSALPLSLPPTFVILQSSFTSFVHAQPDSKSSTSPLVCFALLFCLLLSTS